MRCEHIELVNFCQFRHLEKTFTGGLTAIIGPNGSGKSNFQGAIRFAFTGDNPNPGGKLANICDQAPDGESSYVKLTFTHGSVRAVVQRNLRPSRPTATLTIEGGESVEGDQAVTARIVELLGVGTDIINDIVIVAQDDIFGFLDKTLGKRAEQFQRLFHTEKAAEVHKIIGDQAKTILVPDVGVDLDELRHRISTQQNGADLLTQALVVLPTYEHIQQQRDANNGVIQAFDKRNEVEQNLQRDGAALAAEHRVRTTVTSQQETVQNDLTTVQSAAAGNEEAAEQAKVKLATLEQQQQVVNACAGLQQQIVAVDGNLSAMGDIPAPPDGYMEDMSLIQAEIQEKSTQLTFDSRMVASLSVEGLANCPTCGTATADLVGKIKEARTRIPTLEEDVKRLHEVKRSSQQYQMDRDSHDRRSKTLSQQKEQLAKQLEEMPDLSGEKIDETVLNATVTTQTTYEEGIAEYQQILVNHGKELSRLDGRIEQQQTQIDRLTTELAELPVYTSEQREEAIQNVAGWARTADDRRDKEQRLAVCQSTVTEATNSLHKAEAVDAEASVLRGWLEFASNMRGVVHKDAAPRFVAQNNLVRLQVGTNEGLNMFQTDFRVQADEGLSFKAYFSGGSCQPAERLSNGQKVVLALSFRLALNLMFAEDVGALYLDEPTAWLDEHHIAGFEPVLSQLRQFAATRGLQCFIITHERGLAPLFDTVIEL